MNRLHTTAALAALLTATSGVLAAAITPGDLVIYRVGDGTATLGSTGTAVFVDEYSATGGFVQSIALPSTATGGGQNLVASGSASSEGLINASADGSLITVTGYNTTAGTAAVVGTATGTVNRTIGLLSTSTGSVSYTNLSDSSYTANNIRSAATTDGTTLYTAGTASGANGGVRVTTAGTSTSSTISTSTNVRDVNITGGSVYFSTGSGTGGIYQATGTAATPAQSTVIAASTSPYAFVFEDLSTAVAGVDTLYVADDGGTLKKFTLGSGGTWTQTGSVAIASVRGLTASVATDGSINLFATGGAASNTLFGLTDATGYGGTLSGTAATLATAATNEAFRGVAFVGTPEPTSLALLGLTGVGLLRRRRSSVTR